MGADTVRSVEYSGTGWLATVGQGYTSQQDWPLAVLSEYRRTIDYETRSSAEEFVREQGDYPPQGGGGIPIYDQAPPDGRWSQRFYLRGEYAWNDNGAPAPRLATSAGGLTVEERRLDIWLSPHGALKAAMAARDATALKMDLDGQPKTIVTFTALDRFRVNVTITADNLVERVQTWVPNAVFGDMIHEHRYSTYRDYGGVKFPSIIHSHRGDPRLNPGQAPQDERRSLAVIGEIRRRIPDKPIRYVVNTHYHFDHSGGLRTYVAHGARVVTHASNQAFYEDVFFYPAPRTLEPDLLSERAPWFRRNRLPAFELVTDKYVISDGSRNLDVYATTGVNHDAGMLIAYLPGSRILINADLYGPPAANASGPPRVTTAMRQFHQNIERLGLAVERHVGIHGQVGTHEAFLRIMEGAGN
jgi:glyoxylase-like metal-dependent hydrolase (beta-lactamase superfamily II)